MPSPSAPSWRKIETALIDLLRAEGIGLEQIRGNTYVTIYDVRNYKHEVCLGDFARELEERLS